MVWAISSGTKKASTTTNSYLAEIKPLLILLRVFGRFPYSFEENGIREFRVLSIPAFYTGIFFIVQTAWTVYSLRSLVQANILTARSYDETLYWISLGILNVQNFLVPFTNWMEAPNLIKYLLLWKNFQDEFCTEGLKMTLRLPILVAAVTLVPISTGLIFLQSVLLKETSILILLPYLSSVGSTCTFIFLWVTTLHEIRIISRNIFRGLIKEGSEEIGGKRLMWLKLSGLASSLGDKLGRTGLTYIILFFITFVPTSYGLLSFFFDHSVTSNSFWGLLISAIFCLACKFIICDAAHRTTAEVGEKFSEKILQQDLSTLPQSTVNEVVLFLQTMAANPPEIQFHGFVTASRGLFVSFVSNTVTYLVVLLQFKASSLGMTTPTNSSVHNVK